MGKVGKNLRNSEKSGKKWEKWFYVAKSGENCFMWFKVCTT